MKLLTSLIAVVVIGFIGSLVMFSGLEYVGPNEMMVLIARYGDPLPEGEVLADPGQIGIQKDVLGVGYHWLTPVVWETKIFKVIDVPSNSVGIVTAKYGKKIQGNRFLADRGEIGIQRKVLGPGTYRMNPYGYDVQIVRHTVIEAGSVGVLINNQKGGVQKDRVLAPGTHYINPKQHKVEVVKVGLNQYTQSSQRRVEITDAQLQGKVDNIPFQTARQAAGGAITFPSKDGFKVGLDVTLLWELNPENGVKAIDTYGQVNDLVDMVINPKLDSACRNEGSNYSAKEMIQGDTRALFKQSFTDTLTKYVSRAPLAIKAALPRRVYVPIKIQLPIMQAQLKKEEMLTNKEIEESSKVEAKLEEQKKLVEQEIEQVKADTRVLRASIKADAEKEVGEFEAQTRYLVSKIELEIQKIRAKIANIRSQAEAEVTAFEGEKDADIFQRYVKAFGGVEDFNSFIFADNALPQSKLPVNIIHSGAGTLWTDLKNITGNSLPLRNFKGLEELNMWREENGVPSDTR